MAEAYLMDVRAYYDRRLEQHGPTPAGVDWNSAESQQLRFRQLVRSLNPPADASWNDFGCGYGALLPFLRLQRFKGSYLGYDISPAMIERARKLHGEDHRAGFVNDPLLLTAADYTVASGIFNVKLDSARDIWQSHVVATLHRIHEFSRNGFAFNILTSYSDPPRMRDHLYYADPGFFFDYCKSTFARRVCLLHDYDLYEFTIGVIKESGTQA